MLFHNYLALTNVNTILVAYCFTFASIKRMAKSNFNGIRRLLFGAQFDVVVAGRHEYKAQSAFCGAWSELITYVIPTHTSQAHTISAHIRSLVASDME